MTWPSSWRHWGSRGAEAQWTPATDPGQNGAQHTRLPRTSLGGRQISSSRACEWPIGPRWPACRYHSAVRDESTVIAEQTADGCAPEMEPKSRASGGRGRSMHRGRPHRTTTDVIGTPAVLFVDNTYWDCFAQFAVGLRKAGIRAIRVTTSPPLPMSRQFIYDRTIRLCSLSDFGQLSSLLRGEQIIDVQAVESLALQTVEGLRSADSPPAFGRWHRRARMVDKPTAAGRLRDCGISVPDIITDPSVTPDDVIDSFGLPVIHKLRTGSSGDGVSIIRSREELESIATGDLDPSLYFYERYVDGRHIQFAGIVNAESHDQSVTYETLSRFASMGPASRIRVLDDEELRKCGLRVGEALDICGMINVNVIRDADGKDWVHDVNPRIWGSAVSFRLVGLDFLGAYISWLCGIYDGVEQRIPREGTEFEVFPVAYAKPHPDESTFGLFRRFAERGAPVHQLRRNLVCGLRVNPQDRHEPGRCLPATTPGRGSSAIGHRAGR